MRGTATPICASRSRMRGSAGAGAPRSTVTRTISEPARASAADWSAVASTSAVSVLVIDCTTIGAWPPMTTPPTSTGMQTRRELRELIIIAPYCALMPYSILARLHDAPFLLLAAERGGEDCGGEKKRQHPHKPGAARRVKPQPTEEPQPHDTAT